MLPAPGTRPSLRPDSLLRCIAFAAALAAMPAAAAPLVLNCEGDNNAARQFRVDFDAKTVQEIDVPPDQNPPGRADISDTSIKWTTIKKRSDAAGGWHDWRVVGSINRLAGNIHWEISNPANAMQSSTFSGKCRQATQKF